MTLYDEICDLLALVGRRDCLVYRAPCGLDECEPCTARRLYARMVEARDRVDPPRDSRCTESTPGVFDNCEHGYPSGQCPVPSLSNRNRVV